MTASTEIPACLASRHFQMLVRVAKHGGIGDPEGCAAVLTLLETARRLRGHIHSILAAHGLSDARFAVLVCLYAIDPTPITPAELAEEAQISRAAMSESLESLQKAGHVTRERSATDRRSTRISLSDSGRALIEDTMRPFLDVVSRFGGALSLAERRIIGEICTNICGRLPSHA